MFLLLDLGGGNPVADAISEPIKHSARRPREMDKGDMQRSVESLRNQLNIQRLPVSQSANEYVLDCLLSISLCD